MQLFNFLRPNKFIKSGDSSDKIPGFYRFQSMFFQNLLADEKIGS